MKKEPEISRRCADCPEWTHTVCCFAFGKFWREKSRDGEGCSTPLDEVAESWRKAGWKPGDGVKAHVKFASDGKPKISKKPAMKQANLSWSPKQQKPAEPPPLSDDDY